MASIDRVILNIEAKEYLVIGTGIENQVIKFDSFSDWDSVNSSENGDPIFDIQIDMDDSVPVTPMISKTPLQDYECPFDGSLKTEYLYEYEFHPSYYSFQYVDLEWDEDDQNWHVGGDYQSVELEFTNEDLTELFNNIK